MSGDYSDSLKNSEHSNGENGYYSGSASDANAAHNSNSSRFSKDPYVRFFDERFDKSREYLVFMEETKLYQEMLDKCTMKAGPDAPKQCRPLVNLIQERLKYYNSKYRREFRPTMSPGLPEAYEKRE